MDDAPTPAEPTITLTVRYRFHEYCSIVEDHLPAALAAQGQPPKRLGIPSLLMLRAILAPVFLYKLRRVGECRFDINAAGLTRHARDGALQVPWSEVVAVHRYRAGYLVAKRDGAMPLPYRCFADGERARFEAWVGGGRVKCGTD